MTIEKAKKLYPKFYDNPALWAKAKIQIECIKSYMDGEYQWSKGDKIPFCADMLHVIDEEQGKFDHYKPLFKPQEGDAFLEDLAKAATAACTKPNEHERMVHHASTDIYHIFVSTYSPHVRFFIKRDNIAWARWRNGNIGLDFNVVAYTDTIRGLGYYV